MKILILFSSSWGRLLCLLGLLGGWVLPGQAQTLTNDSCFRALPLACGQRVLGSTVGARPNGAPLGTCLGSSLGTPGAFYRFTPAASGIYTASTCGAATGFPTRLFAFQGSCGAASCVGSPAGPVGCGNGAAISFPATLGSTYFLFVTGTGQAGQAASGSFELSLTCSATDSVSCGRPANVRATRLTDSLAQVTFSPVPGAMGYQVSYQADAGPMQLVLPLPTSGPVLLRVLPGMAYTVRVATVCAAATGQPTTTSLPTTLRLATALAAATSAALPVFEVYPNPAPAGKLQLHLSALPAATVTLVNAVGQVVLRQPLPPAGGEYQVATQGLPAGLYTVQVQQADGLSSSRRIALQ